MNDHYDYIRTKLALEREQHRAAAARRPPVPARSARPRPVRRSGSGAFVAAAGGALILSLDVSVANALMPAIGQDFGDGRAALSWVISGYAIVFAAALVPAGRVADRLGRRSMYVAGLAVFALGSLVCGLAPGLEVLLLGRVIQGLGAAAASPASLGLLLATADDRGRAVLAARWTGVAALGACLGPLVGGAMTDLGDWRWAFLVNLPLVAGVAVAARALLSETPRQTGRRLPDPLGAGMLAAAAALVSLVLSEVTTWGVDSVRFLGGGASAVVLGWAFARRSARVPEPLLGSPCCATAV